jgi:hypothetical protein
MVMTCSSRVIVLLVPLKSKRVVISRRTPSSALSTSASSVLETISKEGIPVRPNPLSAHTMPPRIASRNAYCERTQSR